MAGLPFAPKYDAAEPDLHQLFEAVEARLDRRVEEGAIERGPEARRGQHRVLLGVDAQADVVELARQRCVGLLATYRASSAAAFRVGAVRVPGRRAVVTAAKDPVVADDDGADPRPQALRAGFDHHRQAHVEVVALPPGVRQLDQIRRHRGSSLAAPC